MGLATAPIFNGGNAVEAALGIAVILEMKTGMGPRPPWRSVLGIGQLFA
jgi:hypothetical protein